jgi:hypothetical protein
MVNLAADNSSNLLINCAVGCAGGTSSNASDAVATSATNGQTIAWLYGFNGTTFDRLRVDASKNLNVNIAANSFGTVTVTGTVAATQSGTWNIGTVTTLPAITFASPQAVTQSGTWTVQPGNTANTTPWLVTGSGTAGTAATGVLTVQGIASMTPVQVSQATAASLNATVVGTGTFAVQAAQSGTWNVTVNTALPTGANTIGAVTQASGPWTQNLTQVGGSAIAIGQAAMAASLPVVIASNQSAVPASQSGNWTARIVGNVGAVLDFAGQNAASPANAVLIGGQFNTSPTTITSGNVSPFQLDSAGNLLVNIKAGGSTGATSNASSGVATSSTNTPTVAYTYGFNGTTWDQLQVDTNKNLKITGGVAQGSTTSGQIGSPIMGAVTSAAPAYTTAQTNLLSLDLAGDLRTGIGPTATASMGIAPVVTGSAAANLVLKAGAGNLYSFQVTSGASAGFVLVFDATSAPADGAVTPKKCYQLAANGTLGASWIPGPPLNFATGITVSFSTTGCFTKTASATAFISGEVQ